MTRVLIAGGGLGGLVTALCLHKVGIECEVFEAATEFRPLGVGINLLPHSVRVLTHLGLADMLEEVGVATADLTYFSKHGREIWSEPRGRAAGYRWPQISIHRGEFQMQLVRAVEQRIGSERIHPGFAIKSFVDNGTSVTANFVNRKTGAVAGSAQGDVLVGADGIHSRVRRHFYPHEQQPRFSGRVLWRSMTLAQPFLSGRSMIMAGHARQKFVAYPISAATNGHTLVNWIAELALAEGEEPTRDWNREVPRERFSGVFSDWKFDWLDIPGLIAASGPIYEFPMSDRDPVDRWSFGRVTLLGDAAHPMYPIGSNGASQAILDAAALASVLADATGSSQESIATALQQYEAKRRPDTSKVVLLNRRQGPEAVMQLVEDRAPQGFSSIDDVLLREERARIAEQYKQIAGFDRDAVNALGELKLV